MADLISMLAAVAGSGGGADPNFNQTVLLLHGDGTNGAQNNTFLDSGTANGGVGFTITRNPATGPNAPTQGTFSPFSVGAGEWSNYFDGSGDYLTLGGQSEFAFGTGDFTVEMWIYRQNNACVLYDSRPTSTNGNYLMFAVNVSNQLEVYVNSSSILAAGTINAFAWTHIAVTRSGTNLRGFVNGTQVGSTTTNSTNFINGASRPIIGTSGFTVANDTYTGYISNLRVVKGRAVYTSAFTPPTAPLGATSGGTNPPQGTETSLLTCQSNRFVDNGGLVTPNTITRNGDVRVTPFSPFAPSAAYSAGTNGGSGYFDGTGDYLDAGDQTAFEFGSGDFTIQAWIYITSLAANRAIVGKYVGGNVAASEFLFYVTTAGALLMVVDGATEAAVSSSSGAIGVNEWIHVAASRSSGTIRLFKNGVELTSSANTTAINSTATAMTVGSSGATNVFLGYISGLKIQKGVGVSSITLPTSPPVDSSGTSLLLNFTNAGIFDNTGKNNLETVGNAQIDTAVKKFGTGSMKFDGTGDYLLVPDNPDIQLGTGPFTIEMWVYLASGDVGSFRSLVSKGASGTGWTVFLDTTEKVNLTYESSSITSSAAITTNAWNHIAVVREGTGSNQTKIYLNGTNDGTGTVATNFNQTNVMYVGAGRLAGTPMKGYIDDLRITKGVARYTANFTPPTAAFPNE